MLPPPKKKKNIFSGTDLESESEFRKMFSSREIKFLAFSVFLLQTASLVSFWTLLGVRKGQLFFFVSTMGTKQRTPPKWHLCACWADPQFLPPYLDPSLSLDETQPVFKHHKTIPGGENPVKSIKSPAHSGVTQSRIKRAAVHIQNALSKWQGFWDRPLDWAAEQDFFLDQTAKFQSLLMSKWQRTHTGWETKRN